MAKRIQFFLIIMVAITSAVIGESAQEVNLLDKETELMSQIKENGEDTDAILELVELLNRQNRGEDAVKHARRAVELLPENANANYLLAVSLRQDMGNNPLAWMTGTNEYIKLLKSAIRLDPQFVGSYQELIGFYKNAPFIAGGSKDKALAVASTLQKIDAKKGIREKANIFMSDEKVEEALKLYEDFSAQNPNDTEVLLQYGMILVQNKQYDKAMPLFDKGIECKDDNSPNCLYQAGKVRVLAERELEKAVQCFDQYIEQYQAGQNPTDADALWRKGMTLKKLGRKSEAQTSFEMALQIEPKHQFAGKSLDNLKKGTSK